MSDVETRFHETWLGMVQPIEGLVVSVPVLVDAQCMERLSPEVQQLLRDELTIERPLTVEDARPHAASTPPSETQNIRIIAHFPTFLAQLLGLTSRSLRYRLKKYNLEAD